jgi:acyl carrier protein
MAALSETPHSASLAGGTGLLSKEEVQRAIRDYIVESFLLDDDELDLDTSLIGSGTIDSTGMMEIVAFIEETYGLEVDERDLVPENFDSVSRLAGYVLGDNGRDHPATL